ncbi:hypothetical protein V1J52_18060 [Streptomyces sp. TRM 70351]|uniref:hypothetical protein n=1 Tax=Streptomyces sp. TRM 70351 TaxID=3116552 RepID=UPI002E7AFB9E|nr:hypothetical protein [Streptomyces sp. TRM 70351]MEE1930066.1 hypothetical protein [Streptomyces sp. TRM 70351]
MFFSLSPALLVKAALGASGAVVGETAWTVWERLAELVGRPEPGALPGRAEPPRGQRELAALAAAPASGSRAEALIAVLTRRAEADPEFRGRLERWGEEARLLSHAGEAPWGLRGSLRGSVVQSGVAMGVSFVTYGPALSGAGTEASEDGAATR